MDPTTKPGERGLGLAGVLLQDAGTRHAGTGTGGIKLIEIMTTGADSYHYFRVSDGHGLRRNPLKAIIAPRPIAWVSTVSPAGIGNLAPYSFFNMINDQPPMIMFASTGYKDTVRNIAETREFALSTASRRHAEAMNLTSREFASSIDEFDSAGLVRKASSLIRPPGVDGSPAILECTCVEVRQLTASDGRLLDSWMVIGEVLAATLREDCIVDGLYRTETANPILRAGYADEYWAIDAHGKFAMSR